MGFCQAAFSIHKNARFMPLLLREMVEPAGEIGIWKIQEDVSFFLKEMELIPPELVQWSELRGRRRVEWIAVRYLVHHMSDQSYRVPIFKDAHGKPHLAGNHGHISISHSHDLVACIASPLLVGIDIQFLVPKIERLANKFLNPEELASLEPGTRIPHLHAYWGAKEALYKAYGRRELDFRSNILVGPFAFGPGEGRVGARVRKGKYKQGFVVNYRLMGNFMLVWTITDQTWTPS